ncbi:hypothetical protein Lser_V15G42839 [Lactuca serriola]
MDTFEIDANGILTVTSEIISTGKTEKLRIANENGRLSKEQIQKMVKDAEKYKQEDKEYKKKADALNALDDCIYNMKKKIKNMAHGKSLREMENAITDITKWLEHKQTASIVEIQRMQKHLESVADFKQNVRDNTHDFKSSTSKKLHNAGKFFKNFVLR